MVRKGSQSLKACISHKRLEQSTWVEVEVDMDDRNEDSDVLEFHVDITIWTEVRRGFAI